MWMRSSVREVVLVLLAMMVLAFPSLAMAADEPRAFTLKPNETKTLESAKCIVQTVKTPGAEITPDTAQRQNSVCRVQMGQPSGTGFLVGKNMVLNNHHVVPAALQPLLCGVLKVRKTLVDSHLQPSITSFHLCS